MAANASNRLLSLDVFRGLTIAGMVLVNNPGTWESIYAPLKHAEWHGLTPTDWIFPFFLFIVGIAIPIALGKRAENESTSAVYLKIFRRGATIFLLSWFIWFFPFFDIPTATMQFTWKFDYEHLRIFGVLQRIAICYVFASIIFLKLNWKQFSVLGIALLLIYWALVTQINVPGCEITSLNDKACNLPAFVDRFFLGENHIWRGGKVYDPEGILSTIPAVVTTLCGVLTGIWIKQKISMEKKAFWMLLTGNAAIVLGVLWGFIFPINKALWTSSYVVVTAGIALWLLGACIYFIDIKGIKFWIKPFVIFGVNALALFVGSGLMARLMGAIKFAGDDGKLVALQPWIFKSIFLPIASTINASLLYALAFILLWLFIMWLLYRKQIYIKV